MKTRAFYIAVLSTLACVLPAGLTCLSQERTSDCGVNTLFVAMHALNEECGVSIDSLRETLVPDAAGNSLEQLRAAAVERGFHAVAVQTSVEALRLRNRPYCCIAHLRSGIGHFVLLTDVGEDTVAIADPPRLQEVPLQTFLTEWSGNALLIAPEALQEEADLQRQILWRRRLVSIAYAGGVAVVAGVLCWLAIKYRRARAKSAQVASALLTWSTIAVSTTLMQVGCGAPNSANVQSQTLDAHDEDRNRLDDETNSISGTLPIVSDRAVQLLQVSPIEIDLGDVHIRSEKYTAKFEVKNLSPGPVELSEISTTCGCTVAQPDTTKLASGQSTKLTATVGIHDLGLHRTLIRIGASPGNCASEVAIKWNGKTPLGIEPRSLALGTLFLGTPTSSVVKVTSPDGKPIREWVESISGFPEPDISCVSVDEGIQSTVTVVVCPSALESRGRGTVRIQCRPPLGRIDLPIEWTAVESIDLQPNGAFRSSLQAGDSWTAKCVVRSQDMDIQDVRLADADAGFDLEQFHLDARKRLCTISGHVPEEVRGPWSITVMLDVTCNDGVIRSLPFEFTGLVK